MCGWKAITCFIVDKVIKDNVFHTSSENGTLITHWTYDDCKQHIIIVGIILNIQMGANAMKRSAFALGASLVILLGGLSLPAAAVEEGQFIKKDRKSVV